MYYGTPRWVVVSLLAQAASEAHKGFSEERTPERIAAFVMAGIRGYKASTLIPRDFALPKKVKPVEETSPPPLRDITNGEWKALYQKYLAHRRTEIGEKIDLFTLLQMEGFSSDLRNIDFSQTKYLSHLKFEKVSCYNCNFSNADLLDVLFLDFKAVNCQFSQIKIKHVKFCTSLFISCDLTPLNLNGNFTMGSNTIRDCVGGYMLGSPERSPAPDVEATPQIHNGGENQEKTLKKITQEEWDKIRFKLPLQTVSKDVKLFDFAAFLKREGFSTELSGLNIRLTNFYHCNFEGIHFRDCNFTYSKFSSCEFLAITAENCHFNNSRWEVPMLHNSTFTSCDFTESTFDNSIEGHYAEKAPSDPKTQDINFSNVEFNTCNFDKTLFRFLRLDGIKAQNSSFQKSYFYHLSIENGYFTSCNFSLSSIIQSFYRHTSLIKCDLQQSNWMQTSLDDVTIEGGSLQESSFLQAPVKNSRLINCNLENALLLDAKEGFAIQGGIPHRITKPIVALGWHFDETGIYTPLIRQALRDSGALVLQYEQSVLKGYRFGKSPLSDEVISSLEKLPPSEQSIGQQLLQTAPKSSEIGKLKQQAQEILKHASGLIIPGGEDIEPFFYDRTKKPSDFAFRTILELALLSEAKDRKIPTMGICRGAQMINVFFGGTLHNVEHQFGRQRLEWGSSSKDQELRKALPKEITAHSAHHQAVDQVGKGLTVVLKVGTIPKVLLSEDGNFIASQVHPEMYVEAFEKLVRKIDEKEKGFTEHDLEALKKISSTIQTKMKEMRSQYPDSACAQRFIEKIDANFAPLAKNVDFIFSNKNIYRFFLNKVERFKKRSPQLLEEAESDHPAKGS